MNIIYKTIIEPILSSSLHVVGGIIPIFLLLLFLFYRARFAFRTAIDSEKKLIKQYEKNLKQEQDNLKELNKKINDGTIGLSDEIIKIVATGQNDIIKYDLEIITRKAWISKVKNATFTKWIAYHFTKSYFSDYFKK